MKRENIKEIVAVWYLALIVAPMVLWGSIIDPNPPISAPLYIALAVLLQIIGLCLAIAKTIILRKNPIRTEKKGEKSWNY